VNALKTCYFAEMTERLGAWLQTTILGFKSRSRP
jgi:hypothetical protein